MLTWGSIFSGATFRFPNLPMNTPAAQSGFPVDAKLRFIELVGNLISQKPEDFLTGDLKMSPIYDLKRGKPITK